MTANNEAGEAYIYALTATGCDGYYYVGRTIQEPPARVNGHIRAAESGIKSKCKEWLRSILESDESLVVVVLETTTQDKVREREKYWIRHLAESGHPLTNTWYHPNYKHPREGTRGIRVFYKMLYVDPEDYKKIKQEIEAANGSRPKLEAIREKWVAIYQ